MLKREIFAGIMCVFKPLKIKDTPIHIQVEPVAGCNMRCITCTVKDEVKIMELNSFKKIIDEIKPLNMTLSGLGEPLITPKIFEMISYGKNKNILINLTTNGTLLNEEMVKKIVLSNLDLLSISIDAATKNTYITMRKKDKFDFIINGIKMFNKIKKDLNKNNPKIRTHFVITKLNINEIRDFIFLSKNLSINTIYFQPLDLTERENMRDILVKDLKKEDLIVKLKEGMMYSKELKMLTNLDEILSKFHLHWKKYKLEEQVNPKKCIMPYFSTYITVDGDVRPCCSMGEEGNLGNIKKQDFLSIWNGEKYKNVRKQFREGNLFFKTCKNCIPITNVFEIWKSRLRYTFFLRILK